MELYKVTMPPCKQNKVYFVLSNSHTSAVQKVCEEVLDIFDIFDSYTETCKVVECTNFINS